MWISQVLGAITPSAEKNPHTQHGFENDQDGINPVILEFNKKEVRCMVRKIELPA